MLNTSHSDMRAPLSTEDYTLVKDLILRLAGLHIPDNPKNRLLVRSRLLRLAKTRNLEDVSSYVRMLAADPKAESQDLVSALTTNCTSFYRERPHFSWLEKYAGSAFRAGNCLNVWSAACSTGEEVYSIAMTLAKAPAKGPFHVLGTDIDRQAIQAAQAALYCLPDPQEGLAEAFRDWSSLGANGCGKWRVPEHLQRRTEFRLANLQNEVTWPEGEFDIIFCRNVLIYFRPESAEGVLHSLSRRLKLGGHLVLGHVEAAIPNCKGLRGIGAAIFQRTGAIRPNTSSRLLGRRRLA